MSAVVVSFMFHFFESVTLLPPARVHIVVLL